MPEPGEIDTMGESPFPSEGERAPMSSRALFLRVSLPLLVLYLATASWTLPYHMDAGTNVFTAYELGTHGDVFLEGQETLANLSYRHRWVVPARDTAASQYPPGAAALAAPLYAIWPDNAKPHEPLNTLAHSDPAEILLPPLGPAAITASLVSALAMGLLALVFRRLVEPRTALLAAYVAGLGTGVWSVAADSLWQHGPAMLWIAAGMLLSVEHRVWSGFAFGAGVLTRPHTALIAAGNGLSQSWQKRSIRPAIHVGVGTLAGLVGLIVFNAYVFGSPSISGGYTSYFANEALSLNALDWVRNVVLALIDPRRGLLVYSPFLVLLIPGLRAAWRKAPSWVKGSALGGLAYILLQLKANRYSGGSGFWGYRYPLEMLAAAAPLLLLSYTEWVRQQSVTTKRLFASATVLSIAVTAIGAIYF